MISAAGPQVSLFLKNPEMGQAWAACTVVASAGARLWLSCLDELAGCSWTHPPLCVWFMLLPACLASLSVRPSLNADDPTASSLASVLPTLHILLQRTSFSLWLHFQRSSKPSSLSALRLCYFRSSSPFTWLILSASCPLAQPLVWQEL